jgi:CubicO group peptidase (beta-lactamase class C family)
VDEDAAASVTVLQLLNHTSGWDGDFFRSTGDGDDALARYVEAMTGLRQLTRPGEAVSYNNAAFGVPAASSKR